MLLFCCGWALAQEVPNGDFDGGLSPWTGDAVHRIGATRASPGYVVVRGLGDTGELTSDTFVITAHGLEWFARGDPYRIEVHSDDDETLVEETDESVFSLWWGRFLDVSEACGATVTLTVETLDAGEAVDLDAFVLAGDVCDRFVDHDFDGACRNGTDVDGDGTCDGPGEVSDTLVDCDDSDPTVGPQAPERVANGVDDDCDGLEECYLDTDHDDVGSSDTVLVPELDCIGDGIAAVDGDVCEGFDDRLDEDGDGIPDGCEGARVPPPVVPPPLPLVGRFRGGACACSGGAGSLGGLWLAAALLLVRRRS